MGLEQEVRWLRESVEDLRRDQAVVTRLDRIIELLEHMGPAR